MKATISTTYDLVWQLKTANWYKFTKDGKCINTRTNRVIRKVLCGGSIGYCIQGVFVSATKLRAQLERIEDVFCPF